MNTTTLTQPKTLNNDKDYFSAYLNMARHNAFLILSHISERLDPKRKQVLEDGLSEAFAIKVLTDKKRTELTAKSIDYLNQHFPFIKPMFFNETKVEEIKKNKNYVKPEENIPEKYQSVMTLMLKELNRARNEYTHTIYKPVEGDKKLLFNLNEIFDASVREIKRRFNLSQEDIEHLIRYKQERDKETDKIKPVLKPDFKYNFFENDKINEKGLALFISLFLEKKYAFEFLKRLKGFKDGRTKMMQATLESFCVYHVRLPKERTDSSRSELSLCLDMFNELKKCPGELFGLLNEKDTDKFKIPVMLEKEGDEGNNSILNEEYEENISMKRFGNRFPELALRYIDSSGMFKNLRFHVDLGNYYFKFYNKTGVDGEERERSLKIHLKSFGNPEKLNGTRLEKWNNLIRFHSDEEAPDMPIEELMPYVTDTYPHYHLNNNLIGIKCQEADNKLPELKEGETKTEAPDFWLSVYELPALLLYSYLNSDNPAEKLIFDCRSKYYSFFKIFKEINNIEEIKRKIILNEKNITINKNGKNQQVKIFVAKFKDDLGKEITIELNDIPKVFKELLLNKKSQSFDQHAEQKLTRMLDETESKIRKIEFDMKMLNDKNNKPGKKKYVEIKSGVLADFLAKDMMNLQPSKDVIGKDKITGLDYQVLQSHLAFYGRDYLIMNDIFKQCKLIDSNIEHPFLKHINPSKHKDFVSFYLAYLYERKTFLQKCKRDKNYQLYYFLKPGREKFKTHDITYYNKLARKLLSEDNIPINLPRGLFMDALIDWFKNNGSDAMKIIASSDKVNTIYLLQKFFEIELEDKSQSYYDFKRSYEFIDRLNDTRGERDKFKKLKRNYYTISQFEEMLDSIKQKIAKQPETGKDNGNPRKKYLRAFSDFKQNEKILRLYKTQDMILFLLACKILLAQKPEGLEVNNLKLNEIKAKPENENDKDVLSGQLPFSLQYKYFKSTEKGRIDYSKPIGVVTIIQKELKLKNYGDFIRFTKDRRLNNLFLWTGNTKLERAMLEKELERYETTRLAIFKLVHDFEKVLYKKYKQYFDNKMVSDNKSYIDHNDMLTKFFVEFPDLKKYEEIMKTIRNRFSHNQYPEKDVFEKVDYSELLVGCSVEPNKENELNIALKLKNAGIVTYGKFAQMLTT